MRHHAVDIERGIGGFDRERLGVISGVAAVVEDAEPHLSRLPEYRVAFLELDHATAGPWWI